MLAVQKQCRCRCRRQCWYSMTGLGDEQTAALRRCCSLTTIASVETARCKPMQGPSAHDWTAGEAQRCSWGLFVSDARRIACLGAVVGSFHPRHRCWKPAAWSAPDIVSVPSTANLRSTQAEPTCGTRRRPAAIYGSRRDMRAGATIHML